MGALHAEFSGTTAANCRIHCPYWALSHPTLKEFQAPKCNHKHDTGKCSCIVISLQVNIFVLQFFAVCPLCKMLKYTWDKIKGAIQGLPNDAMDETSRALIVHDYQQAVEDIQEYYICGIYHSHPTINWASCIMQ